MSDSADVAIIGGGAIGLSIAYWTAEQGADVLLLERDQIGRGCSYANGGLIVPSFSLPLASPGTIRELPKLLLGVEMQVKFRPRAELGLYRWILRFLLASGRKKMVSTARELGRLGRHSLHLFEEWSSSLADFGFRQQGWLHLYSTDAGLRQGLADAELLSELGVASEVVSSSEVQSYEPTLIDSYAGAILYSQEAQLEPFAFCLWLAERARQAGVRLQEGVSARSIKATGGRVIRLVTERGEIEADRFVVAAGVWSGSLVRDLVGWLPVEPGMGYSVTFESPAALPRRPLMLAEKHLVVTPMGDRLRSTSGLDLVGFKEGPERGAMDRLRASTAGALHGLAGGGGIASWYGYRPMTPDGLPLVGPSDRFPNLWLATGHGQLGITLAPISGQIVAAQLAGEEPPLDSTAVSPGRYGL